MYQITCKQCEKTFHATHKTRIFCSRACRGKSEDTRIELPCKKCGKALLLPRCLRKKTNFCSKECRRTRLDRKCKNCDKPIAVPLYEKNRKHFCSRECHRSNKIAENRKLQTPDPVVGACWIPLTKGQFALVDEDDYERVVAINWQYSKSKNSRPGYAATRIYFGPGKAPQVVVMHRFVMNNPDGEVDHINMNGLDNRKCNLRVATKSEQRCNQFKLSGTASRYKGVHRHRNKWAAAIKIKGVHTNLGSFDVEDDAARAYDAKARELFGQFARLNFPLPGEQSALRE